GPDQHLGRSRRRMRGGAGEPRDHGARAAPGARRGDRRVPARGAAPAALPAAGRRCPGQGVVAGGGAGGGESDPGSVGRRPDGGGGPRLPRAGRDRRPILRCGRRVRQLHHARAAAGADPRRSRPIRAAATFYVEVMRGTPCLLQLFYIYFVLPAFGIRLAAFTAGVIGLTVNYAAYMSEVYRAGIQAVAKGKLEAAQALGMSRSL